MATRLGIWFAKNSMQQNNVETVMPGMPETLGQTATGEASHAATTNGADHGVIPNPHTEWKGYTSKEKEEHYAHWKMECANDEGPRETGPAH